MFLNLALNARDALGENGRIVFRTVNDTLPTDPDTPHTSVGKPAIRVEVVDNGCGMDEDTQQRMFEPFFTTKPTGKGTGMGLAGVYGTIRRHHGVIHVDSKPGGGTAVGVVLPLTNQRPAHATDPTSASPPATAGNLGQLHILLVDDEPMVRQLTRTMLERMGHQVCQAEGGREAIERCRRPDRPFDLVLLDLSMPEMDGRTTLKELRRIDPGLRVILCSGYDPSRAEGMEKHPRTHFLSKPFTTDRLEQAIQQVLHAD